MAKIIALAAYFYQAAVAFGLLIAVAHLLSPADYAAYSLFISISQFAAIFCFEWVRFACSRFYPGQAPGSEAAERTALTVEFAACSVICILAAVASTGPVCSRAMSRSTSVGSNAVPEYSRSSAIASRSLRAGR